MKPYLLRWYDDTAYHVVDRATGSIVGWVLAGYTGWYAHLAPGGKELDFGTISPQGVGEITVYRTRYRADAADRVWAEHERTAVAS